jgi:diguanylate cyclase (GGDEF)-like protein
MGRTSVRGSRSNVRRVAGYALLSLVPVLALGLVLAGSYRTEARRRGIAEARSEAQLVARTAIEPLLAGHPLASTLTEVERAGLARTVGRALAEGDVARLRLRDLGGRVVFSGDDSGRGAPVDDEAVEAAGGEVVARLTRLNTDINDTGATGVEVVEVYQQLRAGTPARPVRVLEVYLPYAPISRDVSAGLHDLYRGLTVGLALLYGALLLLSLSVSRGLRRQVKVNEFLANHDALTDLPNRSLFLQRARDAVARATAEKPTAIAIVDLDRFKDVNDTLGHHSGDLFLTALAERLAAKMRPEDTVARLGGDEFGLVLQGATEPIAALTRVREILEGEVEVRGLPLSIGASIGFVVAPDDGTDIDELVQSADVAMYVAKAAHDGVVRYTRADDHYDAANLMLVGELRRAIDAGELVLHYQPKIGLTDGRVEAVEALVRWQHPTHGLIGPDRFVPLAEQTDLIEHLTDWVLDTALASIADLDSLVPDVAVAVNVSARSLTRADFPPRVLQALANRHISCNRLIIEITETALLTDPVKAAHALAVLDRAGVIISIDDFGRGQTSLGHLPTLPIHELKIDKHFVTDMLDDPSHAAIVRSVIDLGHNLAMWVVAEGIESDETLHALHEAGCDVGQGYAIARPMPPDALHDWLRRNAASTTTAPSRFAT